MDIQNKVVDQDTEILDNEISEISNEFAETYYFDNEQSEQMEMLVAKAMKLGELYERKKWQAKSQAVPDGFVLVRTKNVKYFSNDGENYEIHDSLEDAKKEAESAIEWFSEQLADQQLNPSSDGNFHQVGYGVILAESSYSIDHIVTQEDIDKGEYSYEVGTQIMSLSLIEASQEPTHE